jgi:hypothetical protein
MTDPGKATMERRRHGTLRRRERRQVAVASVAIGTIAASQWLGRAAGSTRAERRQPPSGDELVDRLLFPANWPSAAHLVPGLQRLLQVGDRIPDGPPDTAWFAVEQVDPPKLLVLHSTTHLPASWRAGLGIRRRAARGTG